MNSLYKNKFFLCCVPQCLFYTWGRDGEKMVFVAEASTDEILRDEIFENIYLDDCDRKFGEGNEFRCKDRIIDYIKYLKKTGEFDKIDIENLFKTKLENLKQSKMVNKL